MPGERSSSFMMPRRKTGGERPSRGSRAGRVSELRMSRSKCVPTLSSAASWRISTVAARSAMRLRGGEARGGEGERGREGDDCGLEIADCGMEAADSAVGESGMAGEGSMAEGLDAVEESDGSEVGNSVLGTEY